MSKKIMRAIFILMIYEGKKGKYLLVNFNN